MKRTFLLGLMTLAISGQLQAQDSTPPTFNIPPPPPQPSIPLSKINLLNLGDPNGVVGPSSAGPGVPGQDHAVGEGNGPGVGPGFGGGVFRVGGGVTPPTVLQRVEAQYSEEARRLGLSGTVVMECIVHKDGLISVVKIVRGLGHGLDENARQALEQWRFRPGMRNGQPVDVSLNVEVNFNIPSDKLPPDIKISRDDLDKGAADDLRLKGIQRFYLTVIVEQTKYTSGPFDSVAINRTTKAFLDRYKIPYADKPAPGLPTLSLFVTFQNYDGKDGWIMRISLSVSEDAGLLRDPKATFSAKIWEAEETLSSYEKDFIDQAEQKLRHVLERFSLAYISTNR